MIEFAQVLSSFQWPVSVTGRDEVCKYSVFHLSAKNIDHLAGLGINVQDSGSDNHVALPSNYVKMKHTINLNFRGERSVVAIDSDNNLVGQIILGSDTFSFIGGHQHIAVLNAEIYDRGRLFWGRSSRTYGCRIWVHGGRQVTVGDDCLFSENIEIRTSDHHSIIDLNIGKQINDAQDVSIGSHVWVGSTIKIMKNVTIGDGSIIASGSIVTRSVSEAEMWAGVPARLIRDRVSWTDSYPADPTQIKHLQDRYGSSKDND